MRELLLFTAAMLFMTLGLQAQIYSQDYQYKDAFGHSYKSSSNLYKDSDNDGYSNYLDRHDRNPNVGYYKSPSYSYPQNNFKHKSSSYNFNSGRTIYTGPRGGKYYINSNGNKTYVKDDDYDFDFD